MWGVYDGVTDACILSDPLEAVCSQLWPWWHDAGCPTLARYVRSTRPRGYPYDGTVPWGGNQFQSYSVVRCADNRGAAVDVVTSINSIGDESYFTEVVFGEAGAIVWVEDGHYFTQPGHEFCCQPNATPTFWSGWGNPVRYDCADGTVYTPADFPDSADTGAPTTGETADTGATCR